MIPILLAVVFSVQESVRESKNKHRRNKYRAFQRDVLVPRLSFVNFGSRKARSVMLAVLAPAANTIGELYMYDTTKQIRIVLMG